jgi:hypothetical protein
MAGLLLLLALAAPRPYTVAEVTEGFRTETGVRLVRVDSASWRDVTTLAPRTGATARLGRFELYVLRPAAARATLASLLQGGGGTGAVSTGRPTSRAASPR